MEIAFERRGKIGGGHPRSMQEMRVSIKRVRFRIKRQRRRALEIMLSGRPAVASTMADELRALVGGD